MNFLRKLDSLVGESLITPSIRFVSNLSNKEILNHRTRLFNEEQQKQLREIERNEKIQVNVSENEHECSLIMNKNLSTPFSCSLHLSEMLSNRSALAKVNDEIWDMHRPLENDCELKFLHFKDYHPQELNIAYWRSCAFILGYVLEKSFKDDIFVELISPTNPHIKAGSFSYDTKINLKDWYPTKSDLQCLSIGASQIISLNLSAESNISSFS